MSLSLKYYSFTLLLATAVCSAVSVHAAPPGKGWEQVWADEFNDRKVDASKWRIHDNLDWDKDGKICWFKPSNVKTENGSLIIENHWYEKPGDHDEDYSGGWIDSLTDWNQGYFEARVKLEFKDKGFWPTFWMWRWMPDRIATEFDIMEYSAYSENPTQSHHTAGKTDHKTEQSSVDMDEWHEWGLLWSDDEVTFYIDGRKQFSSGFEDSAKDERLPIILSCSPNRENHPRLSGTYPRFMVDWVRVWQKAAEPEEGIPPPLPVGVPMVMRSSASRKNWHVATGRGSINRVLLSDQPTDIEDTQRFTIEDLGEGLVAIKTGDGKYLTVDAKQEMRIYATADTVGEWEKFHWLPQKNGTIALRSNKNGKYLTVARRTRFSVSATSRLIGSNEMFVFDIK